MKIKTFLMLTSLIGFSLGLHAQEPPASNSALDKTIPQSIEKAGVSKPLKDIPQNHKRGKGKKPFKHPIRRRHPSGKKDK